MTAKDIIDLVGLVALLAGVWSMSARLARMETTLEAVRKDTWDHEKRLRVVEAESPTPRARPATAPGL